MELYTCKLDNPIVQHPLLGIGGLKENVYLAWVSLKFNDSSAFL